MPWAESWDLTTSLAGDPSSHVAAAIAGWSYPLSREGMAALDLLDVTIQVNSGKRKPKPAPRPWDAPEKRIGVMALPQSEIRAALRAVGHD